MKNVLTVRMLSSSQRVTGSLYQYDYGQILLVKDLPLPDWYEVHFCNAGDKETVTAIGDSEGVLIPDSLLKTGNDIVAYIYLHEDETDGETEYQIRIPVIRRPQPTDIEPTPEEQSTIDQLVIAMNDAVSSASQDAETAEQAKDEAVTAKELADSARLVAELARDAAEEAQSAAENALASAERAKTEADTAASSAASYANESANSSSQAASSAMAAAESATAAAESAENAERSAASIIGSVDIATQKASEAEQSAAEAATSANTASTKASEAASSATTANEKAEGAAASESAALQSALKAEGYAVGQQYGVEAASGPYYENNAQYFRDQAQSASASATSSAGAASQSASNAEQKAVEAGQSAASASQSALLASQSSEDAEQSAAAALESETVAGQHSSNAERSASNALQSATEAAESAESAELSATSAQQSSTNAVQSATSSRQSADEAALSAAGANQSAEAAEQSAESAEQSELSAIQSATNAGNSATSASQSAQTATNKASEAASSASTATTKAGEAAQSATSAGTDALKAEGYAVGKQNGTAVSSGTYFHNNSQYYSEQAVSAKNAAVVAKDRAETVAGSIETAGQAQISAIEAKGAEVKGSIPLDYTEMSEAIVDANNAVEDVVIVSQTQPQSEDNKLWIKDGGAEEFTIPTYEEFNNLNRAFNDVTTQETVGNIFDNNFDEIGYINRGQDAASSGYKRTSKYYPFASGILYFAASESTSPLSLQLYDSNKAFVEAKTFSDQTSGTANQSYDGYFRLYVDKNYSGSIYLSNIAPSDPVEYESETKYYIKDESVRTLAQKVDKVEDATDGNFAGLDSNGGLIDSGHKHSDYLTKPEMDGTNGQVLTSDGNGGQTWETPSSGGGSTDDLLNAVKTGNLFDQTWIDGWISTVNGQENPSITGWKITDYIPFTFVDGYSNSINVIYTTPSTNFRIFLYNSSKEFVGYTERSNGSGQSYNNIGFANGYVRLMRPNTDSYDVYVSQLPFNGSYDNVEKKELKAEFVPDNVQEIIGIETQIGYKKLLHGNLFDNNFDAIGYLANGIDTRGFKFKRTSKFYPFKKGYLHFVASTPANPFSLQFYDLSYQYVETSSFSNMTSGRMYRNYDGFFRIYLPVEYAGNVYIGNEEPSSVVDYQQKEPTYLPEKYTKFRGKTAVFFGDSIIAGDNTNLVSNIPEIIGEDLAMNMINMGFGGCRMADRGTSPDGVQEAWSAFSFYSIVDSITSGDFTRQDDALAFDMPGVGNSFPQYFATKLAQLKTMDFSDVDLILIAYGTNDYRGGTDISSSNDLDTSTLKGALKYSIKKIEETWPEVSVVVVTPIWGYFDLQSGHSSDDINYYGKGLLPDYVTAEKEVCSKVKVKTINPYDELGFYLYNCQTYYEDNVHLNILGRKRYARFIESGLADIWSPW